MEKVNIPSLTPPPIEMRAEKPGALFEVFQEDVPVIDKMKIDHA